MRKGRTSRVEVDGGSDGLGPSSPWTEAAVAEVAHGTTPTVRVSPDGSRGGARQKVERLQQTLAVMENTDGVAVECLKAELEKAKKASSQCRDECPEVHRQVREAPCRSGPRARVGAVCFDRRQCTPSEVGG